MLEKEVAGDVLLHTAIWMSSSSRDIYLHTSSRSQTVYNVHAFTIFDKFVLFFFAYYLASLLLLTSSVLAI